MHIKEIKSAIQELPPKEASELADYQARRWATQIAGDLEDSRFEVVLARVDAKYVAGKATAF